MGPNRSTRTTRENGFEKWATSFGTRMNRGSETGLKKWDWKDSRIEKWDWKDSRIEGGFGEWDWNDSWIEIDDVARSRGLESGIGLVRFCF
jgi:hypothetical protein